MFNSNYQSGDSRGIANNNPKGIVIYNIMVSFLALAAVGLSGLYLVFGRKAMTSIYNGTATGFLSRINISAKLPLSYYLSRADWLIVGTVLALFSLFFLFSAYFQSPLYRPIIKKARNNAVKTFTIAAVLFIFLAILPSPIPALNLLRITAIWLLISIAAIVAIENLPENGLQTIVSLSLLFVLTLYVLYILTYHSEQLGFLFDEDTVAENLQAIFYGFSALMFFLLFAKQKIKTSRKAMFYIIFAIFLFLVTGEEISWGQRIFKLHTPEFWDRVNVQGEITLHNVQGFDANLGLVIIMLGWAVVLPLLGTFWPWARAQLTKLQMPIMPLTSSLAVIIGLSFYFLNYSNHFADEIWELFVSLAFVFFVFKVRFAKETSKTIETVVSESQFIDNDF